MTPDPQETPVHPTPADVTAALLAELAADKAEIAQRSNAQLRLITLNVTAIGAIGGVFLSNLGQVDPRILFVIPIISPLLGMLYLDHGSAIASLGGFINDRVIPALQTHLREPLGGEAFPCYEVVVREREQQRDRWLLMGSPIFVMFAVVPFVALLAPFVVFEERLETWLWLAFVPGFILLALFGWQWWRWVKVQPGPPT